jgi:hypothetical protein
VTAAGHVVLLGDSIFDNGSYVPDEPAVIAQLLHALPDGWRATLLAVDGATAAEVSDQLSGLPRDATHMFVSAGGNDALNEITMLEQTVRTVAEAERVVAHVQTRFRRHYESMVEDVLARGRAAVLCTVYDAIPELPDEARVALTAFNDVILRTAFRARVPVIDLRLVTVDEADYSALSPIEPSARGGEKITRLIAHVATCHDFSKESTVVYP